MNIYVILLRYHGLYIISFSFVYEHYVQYDEALYEVDKIQQNLKIFEKDIKILGKKNANKDDEEEPESLINTE